MAMLALNLPALVAALLACAVVLGWVRLLRWQRQAAAPRGWRFGLLLALQPLAAGLLYRTLLPPDIAGRAGTLVIATAGTGTVPPGATLVALPEAPALADAEQVPDLATALRRHPGTAALQVLGEGLAVRDRDTTMGLGLAFDPPPLPAGLVRLDAPAAVAPGAAFVVGGAVNGVAGGSVRLLDPAGRAVAKAALAPDGEFRLPGAARAAGPALFKLQVRDRDGGVLESASVPVVARTDPPLRLLIVAGAAGPDLKYLRRWAADAGLPMATVIAIGAGGSVGGAPSRLDAAMLARTDLLVLDERSWANLPVSERQAVLGAVRGGLGLLLRVTGPVPDDVRRQWAALGLALAAGDAPVVLRLPGNQQALHGWRLLPAPGAVSLLPRAGPGPGSNSSPSPGPGLGLEGQRLGEWRGLGQGRIGLWPVIDSYALALGGAPDAHAALWSALLAPLARPAAALPAIAGPAIVARRLALCGVAPGAVIAAPDGAAVPLLVDSATGQARCAAFWPRLPGWHRLRSGAASLVFAVADSLPAGIAAREAREATLALVRPAKVAQAVPTRRPGKSWPWFLGFVVVAAGVWWLERSRVGRPGQRFPAPSPAAVRQGQALP